MPTEAQIQTFLSNAVKHLDELRLYAGVNATNFLGTENTYRGSVISDMQFAGDALLAADSLRATLDAAIRQARAVLSPGLREYGLFLKFPETDIQSILRRLHENFSDNSKSVKTRAFTFGTPAIGGGAAGNGALHRLVRDERNFAIEAQHADAKIAECVRDEHSGALEHEEVFELRSDVAQKDALKITGSGLVALLKALSARDSLAFIGNPSFSEFVGTINSDLASAADLINWTITNFAATSYRVIDTDSFRDFDGDVSPSRALRIRQPSGVTTTRRIEQNFNLRRVQLNPLVPMYAQVAFKLVTPAPASAGTGNLVFRMGNVSKSVTFASMTQGAWRVLRISSGSSTDPAVSDLIADSNNWFRQFNKQDPKIEVELNWSVAPAADVEVLVDDVVFAPFTPFDGAWYALLGATTPFLRRDKFTFSDSEVGAKIQHWLWRAFGLYLPHSATPTWADPA